MGKQTITILMVVVGLVLIYLAFFRKKAQESSYVKATTNLGYFPNFSQACRPCGRNTDCPSGTFCDSTVKGGGPGRGCCHAAAKLDRNVSNLM